LIRSLRQLAARFDAIAGGAPLRIITITAAPSGAGPRNERAAIHAAAVVKPTVECIDLTVDQGEI
jgi:hypothetical protein